MSEVHTTYHVQQGSSSTIRVSDESAWYVIGETWEGRRLLNTWVVSRHSTRREAMSAKPA